MTTLEGRRRPTIGESGVYWGLGNVVSSVFRRTFLVIERHLPQVHCFADDTQLYLSFRAGDDNAQDAALCAMEECIRDSRKWLIDGRLLLNDDKTEVLVIETLESSSINLSP
ncbi:hypothetical protein ABFA07_010553 [Porites harrisoni]